MPAQSILISSGSRSSKETRYAPIFTDRFFVGYWSNRNPLRSPLSTLYADGWHLGGTDALIAGQNIELSPRLTLCRRPGNVPFSTTAVPGIPLTFYPFEQFGSQSIATIVDTSTNIYTLDSSNIISIFSKASNAGQSNFLGLGGTLYFGDGAEVMAWQNSAIRNWGISIGPFTSPTGPSTAGTGASATWANPSDVTGAGGYATVSLSTTGNFYITSQPLTATNYSFSISAQAVIVGLEFTFTAFYTITSGIAAYPKNFVAQILKNGSPVGTPIVVPAPSSSGTVTVGGSMNTWGTTFYPNDLNQSTYGLSISAQIVPKPGHGNETVLFSVRNVQATVYGTVAPNVTPSGSGSFVAYSGYSYAAAYGNSASGQVSTCTPVSDTTGPFGGGVSTSTIAAAGLGYFIGDTGILIAGDNTATYTVNTVSGTGAVLTYTISAAGTGYAVGNNITTAVGGAQPGVGAGFTVNVTAISGIDSVHVDLIASTDPQVNQIWLFRTADGGDTWLNLPSSPYQNANATIDDNAADSTLNILEQAPLNFVNNPPLTASLDPVYYLGLVWVHVGNTVYFTRTPSAIVGITQESFPPANAFSFPETVIRKIPFSSGLLIFTTSNIYIILGTNTQGSPLYSAPFVSRYGIQSWNAVWTDGSIIYLFTSDNRLIELNPSSGVSDLGFPIGDQLAQLNPKNVYVTYHSSTSNDVALYIGDGSTGWYRCNVNQAPDAQITGPVWSVKANIVGGLQALVGMETAPGVHQLMMGGAGASQPVLVRDSTYSTFADNGVAYQADCTIGSIVLAQPGQAAICRFITCDFIRTGTSPIVSVLLGEISGSFESISGYVVPDPPKLPASTSLFNNRYYFKQTVAGANPQPIVCRHLQIKLDYGNTDVVQNEILSCTINGAIFNEK